MAQAATAATAFRAVKAQRAAAVAVVDELRADSYLLAGAAAAAAGQPLIFPARVAQAAIHPGRNTKAAAQEAGQAAFFLCKTRREVVVVVLAAAAAVAILEAPGAKAGTVRSASSGGRGAAIP